MGQPSGGSVPERLSGQPQPQAPPQQPPPDGPGAVLARVLARPPTDTVESSFTVSPCPSGQVQGADACAIGRLTSNVAPQARQRYS
jgi:hypothetical protein